jgi:hypothetical protein
MGVPANESVFDSKRQCPTVCAFPSELASVDKIHMMIARAAISIVVLICRD